MMKRLPQTSVWVVITMGSAMGLTRQESAAAPPAGYYDTVNTSSQALLRQTLHDVIDDHVRIPYTATGTDTWDVLELADQDPTNSNNILDVYRNASYEKEHGGNNNYQREHTWPNSYGFPDDNVQNYPYTDCHALFLCNGSYNGSRSNRPFRYCPADCNNPANCICPADCTEKSTEFNNGRGGGCGVYPGNSNWTDGSPNPETWEVWWGRRGDVARALFYLDVRYEGGSHGTTFALEPDLRLTNNACQIQVTGGNVFSDPAYMGILSDLVQWHLEDPVDGGEELRNDIIYGYQNNRNPFVDHPEWVVDLYAVPGGAAPSNYWVGATGGFFTVANNWIPTGVPVIEAMIANATELDNTCILNTSGQTNICRVTVEASGAGTQFLQINDGSILMTTVETLINMGGAVTLSGGELAGGPVTNVSNSLTGYGIVSASVINQGLIEAIPGAADPILSFTGCGFNNQATGELEVRPAGVITVDSPTFDQLGLVTVGALGTLSTPTEDLTNAAGGEIQLFDGILEVGPLVTGREFTNNAGASVFGFGTIRGAADLLVTNNGDIVIIANMMVEANLVNDGMVTIQSGFLTITRDLSGGGVVIGDFGGRGAGDGSVILGDFVFAPNGSLLLTEGLVVVLGDVDLAIDDDARLDLSTTELQLNGITGTQTLEVLAQDAGHEVTLPDASLFSIGKLRVGPAAATVQLVDLHDNDAGAGDEVLYVGDLVLEEGVTLDLAGMRLYYETVTPSNPCDPESGITVMDSVGGGCLCQIGAGSPPAALTLDSNSIAMCGHAFATIGPQRCGEYEWEWESIPDPRRPEGGEIECLVPASFEDGGVQYQRVEIKPRREGLVRLRVTLSGQEEYSWETILEIEGSCAGSRNGGAHDCGAGAGVANLRGLDFQMSMGDGAEGKPAGVLWLRADAPSESLAMPAALSYDVKRGDIEVIRDENGHLRQVLSLEALADVVVADSFDYSVDFYTYDDRGTKTGGVWVPDQQATPFVTWRIHNPNGASSEEQLEITKKVGGAVKLKYLFTGDDQSSDWTLVSYDVQDAVLKQEALTLNGAVREYVVRNAQSNEVYRVHDTLADDLVTQREVDPNGASLTTTYTYYTSGAGKEGRLKSVQSPDGDWFVYDYDSWGRTTKEIRPWKDLVFSETPTESQARVIEYSYAPVDEDDEDTDTDGLADVKPFEPRTVTETTLGEVTSKTFYGYPTLTHEVIEQRCTDNAAECTYNSSSTLTTVTTYTDDEYEDVASIVYPDGREDTYEYATGTFTTTSEDPADWAFSAGVGTFEQVKVSHGPTDSASGINGKSTQDRTIRDARGSTVYQETYVYNAGYETDQIAWAAHVYDDRSRLTETYRSDGAHEEFVWDCCGYDSTTDAQGIQTSFGHDALGRTYQETKQGVPASGSYGAQGPIVTARSFDPLDRVTEELVTDDVETPTVALTTSRTFDLAGRLTTETNEVGLTTDYNYDTGAGGGQQVTVTRPGGATEITDYFRDGRINSVTGTGLVGRFSEYGVNADGSRWTMVTVGVSEGDRYTTTTTDVVGRTVQTERPGHPAGVVRTTNEYDSSSRLTRVSVTDGAQSPNRLQADTLYVYGDGTAEMPDLAILSGLDVDSGGSLALNSMDRITKTDTKIEEVTADEWWTVERTYVYPIANEDDDVKTSESRQQLTELPGGVNHLSQSIDIHGNVTTTTTEIDRTNKLVTQTVDAPDSDTDAVTVTRNGLVQSSTTSSGVAFTFAYDGLGRRTGVTDPRTGTSTTIYNSHGQVGAEINAAGDDTAYAYDNDEETGTGLLVLVKNVDNKDTHYEYNDRGQIVHIWGDVPQPVEIGYDSAYAERITLKTYRGGTNWSDQSWPTGQTGTADTTTWTYDEATGLLESKTDAASEAVTYTYTIDGKLDIRTWARNSGGITTDYGYDANAGELISINFSDSTPDVAFTYDRLGRLANVSDTVGSRTFNYDANTLQLANEDIAAGGGGLYTKRITRLYESGSPPAVPGRHKGLQVGTSGYPDADYDSGYYFDGKGRLNRVTGPGLPAYGAVYSFAVSGQTPVADLVTRIDYKASEQGDPLGSAIKTYESNRDLIDYVENIWDDETISKYDYVNDDLGRRESVVYTGSAFADAENFRYGYNDRNELTGANRFEGDDPEDGTAPSIPDQQFTYAYDNIGNRQYAVLPESYEVHYTANNLNQYDVSTNHIIDALCDDAQQAKLVAFEFASAGDTIGYATAMDGNVAVIGLHGDDDVGSNSGAAKIIRYNGSIWQDEVEITASDAASGDTFGAAVAVEGDVVLASAYMDDDGGSASGSVYVFRCNIGVWTQEAKLIASDDDAGDHFGYEVGIDGDVAVIGAKDDSGAASGAGAAYIFRKSGSWSQETKLTASDAAASDGFGKSAAIDGNAVVVGAYGNDDGGSGSGSAYVFRYASGSWSQEAKLLASDDDAGDDFGFDVAISGDAVIVGASGDSGAATDAGAAYIFRWNGTTWSQEAKLTASDAAMSDFLGLGVDIDGDVAIAGAYGDDLPTTLFSAGSAYIFRKVSGSWSQESKRSASDAAANDNFAYSVALSGSAAICGARNDDDAGTDAGSAYLQKYNGSTWSQLQKFAYTAAGDNFGAGLGIDHEIAVAGAPGELVGVDNNAGAVHLFRWNGTTWSRDALLTASDSTVNRYLGCAAAIDYKTIVAGAYGNSGCGTDCGAAYVFARPSGGWETDTETGKLTPSDGAAGDKFGSSVAVSGDWIIAGSPYDDSSKGSAYLFQKPANGWVTNTQTAKITASDGATSDLFGYAVAITGGRLGGTPTAVVGAYGDDTSKGSAYVFRYNGTTWSQLGKLTASDRANSDKLGFSVAMDGGTIIAGAYGDDTSKGSAYVFVEPASGWTTMIQTAKITASDGAASDNFGYGVSIHKETIIVGAPLEESTGTNRGSAYVYHRPATGWSNMTETIKLTATGLSDNDESGRTVSVSGDHALVSAILDDDGGSASGSAFAFGGVSPCRGEEFIYDEDGNLTADESNIYEWDAENRLIAVYPTDPDNGDAKLVFKYDYRGRRAQKEVYEWDASLNGGNGAWETTPVKKIRFVYDELNVLLELDGLDSNAVIRKYTWGLDLSGQSGGASTSGLHGAGGIGGLLAARDADGADDYAYLFDAGGNVGQMIDASTGLLSAHYEYDAYGNLVFASGSYVAANPFRFNTQYFDPESDLADTNADGLYSYGLRYFSPSMGGWLNRDPLGGTTDVNAYSFLRHRPRM